jgi:hypothetical protein
MDERETRTEVKDDRADATGRIALVAGEDAIPVLRRLVWGAVGVSGIGLLLLGTCALYLREVVIALHDIGIAIRGGK